jgi:succinate dehydrogenase flavin-adding protein (antitoxin of CptAB toxin-antitoxin module)
MRELDLLLEKFLATGLQSLDIADLDRLEKLLAQPDQDILAWLTADPKPDDAEIRRIVALLRDRIFPSMSPHD